ncbi:MAG: hypothetical protein HYT83_03580 [Candidatus Levybacteria bacterium]|nr:hypothetical protein [Candidatus Levybacteria bacterium]
MRSPDFYRPPFPHKGRQPNYFEIAFSAVVAVAVAAGVGTKLYDYQQGPQPTSRDQGRTLFLDRQDGLLVVVDKPQPVQVEFSSVPGLNNNKVPIRRNPKADRATTLDLYPGQIQTLFAARVLGEDYPSSTTASHVSLEFNKEEYSGGLWFALTDQAGRFVDPLGNPVPGNESPYYIGMNFTTVIGQAVPTSAQH